MLPRKVTEVTSVHALRDVTNSEDGGGLCKTGPIMMFLQMQNLAERETQWNEPRQPPRLQFRTLLATTHQRA